MTEHSKILIADDEQECIDFVRESLADMPYEVLAAKDAWLAVAREHGDPIPRPRYRPAIYQSA